MNTLQKIYKIARSVLFTVIVTVAALYLILYIVISVPSVQNKIKEIAQKEASKFLGSEVEIGTLGIHPFNEVVLHDVIIKTPADQECIRIETVGAGISLWRFLNEGKIEFSYGEIIGLRAEVSQPSEGSGLNIQFLIDAFKPKDKNKPPTKFDINLRNVVLRRCAVIFDRQWMPIDTNNLKTDFNHIRIYDLKADVAFPQLKNDDFKIDLRRLSFKMSGGLDVEKLAFTTHITPKSLSVNNLAICLPSTDLHPSDFSIRFDGFAGIKKSLSEGEYRLVMIDNKICPADFAWLSPKLRNYPGILTLNLECEGNLSELALNEFRLGDGRNIDIVMKGNARNLLDRRNIQLALEDLNVSLSRYGISEVLGNLPQPDAKLKKIIMNLGNVEISAIGNMNLGEGSYNTDSQISSELGRATISASATHLAEGKGNISARIVAESFDIGTLAGIKDLGLMKGEVNVDGLLTHRDFNGQADISVSELEYRSVQLGGISAAMVKNGKDFDAACAMHNTVADINADMSAHIEGEDSWLNLNCDIGRFIPSLVGLIPRYDGYKGSGRLTASLQGNDIDNMLGEIRITDLGFSSGDDRPSIDIDRFIIKSEKTEEGRHVTLQSELLDGEMTGSFKVKNLPHELQTLASAVMPSLVAPSEKGSESDTQMSFSLLVHPDNTLTEFFNLPIRLLVDIPVEGSINSIDRRASFSLDVPYLQQGKNKLLRDNRLTVQIDGENGTAGVDASTTFPVKRGELSVGLNLLGRNDNVLADIDWINTENSNFKGALSLGADISKNELTSKPDIFLDIKPSTFNMGSAKWNIDKSRVIYSDNIINVEGIKIWHSDQFVEIDGIASAAPSDSLTIRLADIDLDYVFETLNINYVTFGGTATGELMAKGALGKDPVALTDSLSVKQLSYNGTVLGDAVIKSRWNNLEKEVEIGADIVDGGKRRALIDGGIWVTRDSLSFSINANEVNLGFISPFMGAFASNVGGRASGNAKLFGTFSDIDLVGRIFADSVGMKLDFTNTTYHGSDSVYLHPGRIEVPSFRLYDRNGNSALLTGELTHRYFHDPRFNFRISDARRLLCYDTNQKMNPDWYGTIYGNGGAIVRGWPGTVSVSIDMAIAEKSTFTFVLNDTEAAADYHFLTFSDKKKEAQKKLAADSVPDVLAAFRKKVEKGADVPTRFLMDIRSTVSPVALMTLVMDPVAGDKITARGNGAIQIDYESDTDEMQMFGKYTLEEGNYNFSLQDLILRDFTIRPGSAISFNGDPLNANLDIVASYRVNTNLSDLDKSFSTDRELARTNVPVDALLMVKGDMQQPDITFDIELPTLTQDVARKVKSIISTDDMMSRQIIYLLALNRFYTPEYMGSSGSGGELAAVASTTLSTQLSNMLGQLTDKFTVAPTFRSDKGDFSDLEVDVALSSRLLNNRLLVNGNFGYRDKSTSTTTFVGDFDIEYLLNRSGNLRLKAYNHFNDQNYYLREALTTQGLGIVYRRDFDNPFTFLKRKKKASPEKTDSVTCHDTLLKIRGKSIDVNDSILNTERK